MRPLGYVLLVFNLLAAGAFVYFGVQDWRGRQEITASALRHIVLIRGVPFDGFQDDIPTDPEAEVPFLVEMSGGVPNTTVGPEFLKSYFKDASAGDTKSVFASTDSVASQKGELKRVRARLKAAFDSPETTPAAKLKLLEQCLEYQPETYLERVVIRRLVDAKAIPQLAVLLDLKFQQIDAKMLESADAALVPDAWNKLADSIAKLEADATKAEAEAAQLDKDAAEDRQQAALADDDLLNVIAKKKTGPLKSRVRVPDNPEPELRETAARKPLDAATKTRDARKLKDKAALLRAEAELLRPVPTQGEGEMRARLAHLLVHLDTDAAWQKRVLMVVGLKQYIKTVGAQVLRFRQMADQVERLINQDQRDYDSQMSQYRGLAIQRTQMLMQIQAVRDRLVEQKAKDEVFRDQRKRQLSEIADQLAKVRNDVNVLLAEQTGIEKELYTLQRDIAVTLDDVYDLQEQLAEAEKLRFRP